MEELKNKKDAQELNENGVVPLYNDKRAVRRHFDELFSKYGYKCLISLGLLASASEKVQV